MGEIYEIEGENVKISSPLPIIFLAEMEIEHKGNEHGKLRLKAVVDGKAEERILRRYWFEEKILVEKKGGDAEPLFHGKIESLLCRKENRLLSVEIVGIGETVCLDRERKTCSFQNPKLNYQEIIKKVIKNCGNAAFIWGEYEDRPVGEPLIQYNETEWDFLVRLCSHFHGKIFPDLRAGKPDFYFGLHKGMERSLEAAEIIENGFDGDYYINGCWEDGFSRSRAVYLKVRTKENWQMGDFLIYEGRGYLVYERKILFVNGELLFVYKLGTDGMYREKKKYNESLTGTRFTGIVKKVQGESVYLQLDVDQEEQAGYPWEWAPETNNICYCMPEEGTKATLVFSSREEKSGYAILAETGIPEDSGYTDSQNREFMTKWKKRIGLYPARMFLEGEGGSPEIVLEDSNGILLRSQGNLSVFAEKNVYLKGKRISVAAPLETVCRTPQSNIELCRDINLYASAGVKTIGTGNVAGRELKDEGERRNVEHWRASYAALAAIPAVDLEKAGGTEEAVDIFALGSIPKIAKGSVTIAMSEVMEGKKESECSFPKAFQSMNNYTVKGGYALPEEKADD